MSSGTRSSTPRLSKQSLYCRKLQSEGSRGWRDAQAASSRRPAKAGSATNSVSSSWPRPQAQDEDAHEALLVADQMARLAPEDPVESASAQLKRLRIHVADGHLLVPPGGDR